MLSVRRVRVRVIVALAAVLVLLPFAPGVTSAAWSDPGRFSGTLASGSWNLVEIRSNTSGACLDVNGASFVAGAQLQVYGCNLTVAQKFLLAGDGTIRVGPGWAMCLGVNTPVIRRSAVILVTCGTAPTSLVKWTKDVTNGPSPQVKFVSQAPWTDPNDPNGTFGCLDNNNSTADYTRTVVYTCVNGSANQAWTITSSA